MMTIAEQLNYIRMMRKDEGKRKALATIPDLPEGWMKLKHDWDACVA